MTDGDPLTVQPPHRSAPGGTSLLPLSSIRLDGGTQPRARIDEEHVARLRDAMDRGVELPPVVVFFDGAVHWLADGFHRYHAARAAQVDAFRVEVRTGTRRDAVLFSLGANDAHGLPRSSDDKRSAVTRMLEDAEWATWSDRRIADTVHCSHTWVAKVRENWTFLTGNQLPVPEKRVGKDGKERALPKRDAVREMPASDEALPSSVLAVPAKPPKAEAKSSAALPPPAAAALALPDKPKPRRVSADDPPDAGTLADEAREALESAWAYVNDRMHPAASFDALRAEWKRLDAHMAKLEAARPTVTAA